MSADRGYGNLKVEELGRFYLSDEHLRAIGCERVDSKGSAKVWCSRDFEANEILDPIKEATREVRFGKESLLANSNFQ